MRTLRTEDGLPLHWRQWSRPGPGPARGTVLIVHGLGEHIGRYEHLAGRLNDWGWHVVGHDQRGHGASGGPRGDIPAADSLLADLAVVIDELRADTQFGAGPLVLLGHSMGGLVAARFVAGGLQALGHGGVLPPWFRPVDALVLSSPALDPGLSGLQRLMLGIARPLLPHLAVGNGLKPAWISRDAAVVAAYKNDPLVHDRVTANLAGLIAQGGAELLEQAPQWVLPTLLLWAGADQCVDPEGSAQFAAEAPRAVLQSYCFERLYHELFNEPEHEQVFARLQAWLDDRFAPGGAAGSPLAARR